MTQDPLTDEVRQLRNRVAELRASAALQEPRSADGANAGRDGSHGQLLHLRGTPVLDVQGVCKSFRVPRRRSPGRDRLAWLRRTEYVNRPVLEDVSFSVAQGEFFGVLGLNGAGKSTLLKLIVGSYRTDAGRIRIAGNVAALLELGVGFNPDLTARDNVIYNGVLLGLSVDEAKDRLPEILAFADLEEFSEMRLRMYSSGMRVRLGFAVMMLVDADVFLVDEALSVGDAAFQERCEDILERRRQEGKTIVLVSQSVGKITRHCTHAVLLHKGRVEAAGATDTVADRYAEILAEERAAHADDVSYGDHRPVEVGAVGPP